MREDLEDNGIIENGVVLIKDNRIIEVGDVDVINIPSNAEIIDANGMYLLPGFVDLHSHMDRYGYSQRYSLVIFSQFSVWCYNYPRSTKYGNRYIYLF